MKSMTGFGHGDYQTKNLEIDVNLRAVNGRFFEVRSHMPKELIFLESEFKKILAKKVSRGTLDLYIHRRSFSPGHQELKIESKLAKDWVKSLKKLSKETGLDFKLSLIELAQLPGVASTQENFKVSAAEKKVILQTIEQALVMCIQGREREGRALKTELGKLLTELSKIRQRMQKLRAQANRELTVRYKEKIKKWTNYDENRWAQEISSLLDKADINEEISRLGEHLKSCRKLLSSKGPVGKKLDFYSQEILREINTIGSKSQVSRLTEAVVDAKSIIERFREQVQNVE